MYSRLISCCPRLGLALRELDGDARGVDAAPDRADDVLVACRLEDVVVLDERPVVRQVGVALRLRLLVRVAEQEELQLRAALHRVAERLGTRELVAQDLARRHGDRLAGVLVEQVAHHERGPLEPRHVAQRREVGTADEVAVALVPARELEVGEDGHVDVDREQVAARLDAVAEHVIEEEVPGHPLADEATLVVGEDHEDGVDVARLDPSLELLGVEHPPDVAHRAPFR